MHFSLPVNIRNISFKVESAIHVHSNKTTLLSIGQWVLLYILTLTGRVEHEKKMPYIFTRSMFLDYEDMEMSESYFPQIFLSNADVSGWIDNYQSLSKWYACLQVINN